MKIDNKGASEEDSLQPKNVRQDNNKKSVIRTSSLKLEHVRSTALIGEDQILSDDNTNLQSEDLNGSGMQPLTTESLEETHNELLSQNRKRLLIPLITEIKPVEMSLIATHPAPSALVSTTSTITAREVEKREEMLTLTTPVKNDIPKSAPSSGNTSDFNEISNNPTTLKRKLSNSFKGHIQNEFETINQ
ncbi:hypothetical protein KIN20_005086 [Parelaphostrongylus tenuis]|uniref:Uncharacterized protein n=1 Tax=Parelaphostrongylus tenuis TaxID=148309 RepID=A0AAD5M1K5_PARTN|nr:hypothetical protein KIN20_005086 [Parelaphostrongylus tenuis]